MPITTNGNSKIITNGSSTTMYQLDNGVPQRNGVGTITNQLINQTINPSPARDQENNSSAFENCDQEEEHYEFSPEFDVDDDARGMASKRDLSSDSFRSTTSSSSINSNSATSNGTATNGGGNLTLPALSRGNPLRQSFTQRNCWVRSSLRERRRSPSGSTAELSGNGLSSKRQLSAKAHASQMFHGSPLHGDGSRRSSISNDELANDLSLEDDVLILTQKISALQEQVSNLQANNDERYTKVKQENAQFLSKIHTLEEQLRDIELQGEERRKEEEKRFKEAIARHERDKSFECEQYINRVYSLQQELLEARDETRRFQATLERRDSEKLKLQTLLNEKEEEIDSLKEQLERLKELSKRHRDEEIANGRVIDVLNQELDELRSNSLNNHHRNSKYNSSPVIDSSNKLVSELKQELKKTKLENEELRETNEELQAQLLTTRLEEGRSLLKEQVPSLADEMGSLSEDQLRRALKEQQDVNTKLRAYIDGILLNIVENYPQLLEVKADGK